MNRFILRFIIIFLLLCVNGLYGQDSVKFIGLKKTNEAYLQDLLSTNPIGVDSIFSNNLQILKNLPGVANATYSIIGDTVVYNIEERRTGLPILNLGGVKDNLWFSIGWNDYNFRGRNESLLTFYQNNDGRNNFKFYYKNPRIKNSKWGYDVSINRWASIEPIFFQDATLDYLFDNNGLGLSLIRNFSKHENFMLGGVFFKEIYERVNQDISIGPDQLSLYKFLSALEINSSHLNYDRHLLEGYQAVIRFQNVYNIEENSFFNSLSLTGKYFLKPFPNSNLAARLRLAFSTNNFSPFAPFVLDSRVNIRGVGNRIDRGTAQVVLNVEWRQKVFSVGSWTSQLVVFSDAGSWRNPGGEFSDLLDSSQFRHFVGMGVRLIYQDVFGATLRVDYGFDLYDLNQNGIVIGLGQYL